MRDVHVKQKDCTGLLFNVLIIHHTNVQMYKMSNINVMENETQEVVRFQCSSQVQRETVLFLSILFYRCFPSFYSNKF